MRFFISAAITALLALPTCANAEDDQIVVTATRAPVPASRLPARIDVISHDDIEARALSTLPQALGAASVQSGGAGQQTSLFLRGANSNHALALLDGVRLNDASAPNGQYDFGLDTLGGLSRIEVLRGPASSVYGSDALGGVVNMIPLRGGETPFAPFAELAGGSMQTVRGVIGASGAIGGLDYGVIAEAFRTAGYNVTPKRMTTSGSERDGAELSALTASARYEAGAFGMDALFRARQSETEFDTFSGGAFFSQRADDTDLRNESAQNLWRIGADAHIGGAETLRLEGGQVNSDRSEFDDGAETSAAQSTRDFLDLSAHTGRGAVSLRGGFAFERNHIDTRPQFADLLAIAENQRALYLVGQYDLNDATTLTASVRADDYESFGAQTTYSLGGVLRLRDIRLFGSYGTAFKAPSLSERFETGFFNVGNPDLAPETSSSWEIGADWTPLRNASVGLSYYQSRIDDLIVYDFLSLQNINIGRADIDGAEAFLRYRPAAWLELRGAYAWTDARNADTDRRLLRRPENVWRVEAHLTPMDHTSVTLSWDFVGPRRDVLYDDAGEFITGDGAIVGYDVGALAATYTLRSGVEAFVRVDNVAGARYEQPAAFTGAPRSGQIGLRTKF